MDRKIVILIGLALSGIMILAALFNLNPLEIMIIPFGLFLLSLAFFSRGILIWFTLLCLMFGQTDIAQIKLATVYLRWVFFALFGFHVFGDIFLGRTVRKIKSFDILAFVFIIYAFLSASYSINPALTLERATTVLFLYISVFWIIWKYTYDQGPEKIIYFILQVAMFFLIICYATIFIAPSQAFQLGRFKGMFQNPNSMGIACSLFLPLALWRFLTTKSKIALFLSFLMIIGLIMSASRNSLIAIVVGMIYFIYMNSKKYRPLVFFSSASFLLILVWIIQTLAKQLFATYIRVGTLYTGAGRFEVWPFAIDFITDKPIFGYGFGTEDVLINLKIHQGWVPKYFEGGVFHNSYLGMTLQLGIVGSIMFFIPLFILLFKELFLRQNKETPIFRYALRTSLIVALASCIFESWPYSVGNAFTFPFWIIVMLLLFYRNQDKEKIILDST